MALSATSAPVCVTEPPVLNANAPEVVTAPKLVVLALLVRLIDPVLAVNDPKTLPALLSVKAPPVPSSARLAVVNAAVCDAALVVVSDNAPPCVLIAAVLGSIMGGIATPTEAASVGAVGALLIALLRRRLSWKVLRECVESTAQISAMVFLILIGASIFSLVFRGYDGDALVANLLHDLPGGVATAVIAVMILMFLLGFILDFIEITFVVVPSVGPILLAMGVDPVWLGVMMALNLQTSFLTPPFGFALFYLRGVAPDAVATTSIYRGVVPFIAIQVGLMALLAYWPGLVTWLPSIRGY